MKITKKNEVDAVEPEAVKLRTVKTRETCRHPLTIDQQVDAGKELAETQREARQLEDDFKSVRDEWKSRISATEARMTTVAGRISRGYDMKDTECTVFMDTPEAGFKTCLRDDTAEKVWVREMTSADKQLTLDLEEKEDAEAAKEKPVDPDKIKVIAEQATALATEHGVDAEQLIAAMVAINDGAASVAALQRAMRIGYTSAKRLFDVATLAGAPAPVTTEEVKEEGTY